MRKFVVDMNSRHEPERASWVLATSPKIARRGHQEAQLEVGVLPEWMETVGEGHATAFSCDIALGQGDWQVVILDEHDEL